MQNAVTVENLTVGYKKPLISDICFNVKSGKIMTLIGPNGSGKSTILKTLSGYLKKLGGKVCFDGIDSDSISDTSKAKFLSVLLTQPMLEFMLRAVGLTDFATGFDVSMLILPSVIVSFGIFTAAYISSNKIKQIEVRELITE